ncbi:hypothetical protein EVAR_83707_1 [Eumeta japonica]|uniref:Uncharacterized protein n=1 Tax=Eumeta variegata TaxID=151549 RepID=A0A4C1W9D3_EUMVA|nr:hypothetical protein EVAR_83707_1 [Eumeta japonica]
MLIYSVIISVTGVVTVARPGIAAGARSTARHKNGRRSREKKLQKPEKSKVEQTRKPRHCRKQNEKHLYDFNTRFSRKVYGAEPNRVRQYYRCVRAQPRVCESTSKLSEKFLSRFCERYLIVTSHPNAIARAASASYE